MVVGALPCIGSSHCRRLSVAAGHLLPTAGQPRTAVVASTANGSRHPARIAVAKLQQETNDLNPIPTTRADFEAGGFYRKDELFAEGKGLEGSVEGFLAGVDAWETRPQLVGIAHSAAWAIGRLTTECWNWLLDEYLGGIAAAVANGGLDGIYMILHGAMVVDGLDDPEGELLRKIRGIVGPDTPVVASYDIHLHLTPEMCEYADATVVFHTSPHVDIFETGKRSAAVMEALLRGAAPATAYLKLPLNLPVERANTQPAPGTEDQYARFPPAAMQTLQQLEAELWCLSAGISYPQPWMNLAGIGAAVVVTYDSAVSGARNKAEAAVSGLAERLFNAREEFMPVDDSVMNYAEAVAKAFDHTETAMSGRMVVLGDGVDSTNAGAPGDSNWLLTELLRYEWPSGGAMTTMVAPTAVAQAQQAGVGARLKIELGGLRDINFSAPPLAVQCVVEKLFDASFYIEKGHCAGMDNDLGQGATLRITSHGGKATNVAVVCTTGIGAHFAAEMFQVAGLDPWTASVLVAKSPAGYRATYGERASLMITIESPGCAPPRFWLPEFREAYSEVLASGRLMYPWAEPEDYDRTVSIVASELALVSELAASMEP